MKHYCDADARCPFYQCEEQQAIHCEGVDPKTRLHLAFSDRRQLRQYKYERCRANYGQCIIARMLEEKWSGDIPPGG